MRAWTPYRKHKRFLCTRLLLGTVLKADLTVCLPDRPLILLTNAFPVQLRMLDCDSQCAGKSRLSKRC